MNLQIYSKKKCTHNDQRDPNERILRIQKHAMFAACDLRVFDLLHESDEPLCTATIATRLSTSEDGLDRLLSACVGLKLLKVEMKNNEVFYSNTELANIYLIKSGPRSLYHMMMYYSHTLYMCWNFLPDAIREGKSQYERAFGMSSKDIFEALHRSKVRCEEPITRTADEWVIVGNCRCSGALAKQFVSEYPGSSVTVLDLPKVVKTAKKHFTNGGDCNVSFHEGDFFKYPIPEADLFIMARIIHDWTEDKCLQLLKKMYQSCRPGGGVLLIEVLLNEDKSGPLTSQLYSLNMLVQTEGKASNGIWLQGHCCESNWKDLQCYPREKINLLHFIVSYLPGSKNIHADALSHQYCPDSKEDSPPSPIIPADRILATIRTSINSPLGEEILAAQASAPAEKPSGRCLVQARLRIKLLETYHTSKTAGHTGRNQLIWAIS
ncbi:acetylserotonin O-methyltransferase-like [Rhinophrynus dorsalis]